MAWIEQTFGIDCIVWGVFFSLPFSYSHCLNWLGECWNEMKRTVLIPFFLLFLLYKTVVLIRRFNLTILIYL